MGGRIEELECVGGAAIVSEVQSQRTDSVGAAESVSVSDDFGCRRGECEGAETAALSAEGFGDAHSDEQNEGGGVFCVFRGKSALGGADRAHRRAMVRALQRQSAQRYGEGTDARTVESARQRGAARIYRSQFLDRFR